MLKDLALLSLVVLQVASVPQWSRPMGGRRWPKVAAQWKPRVAAQWIPGPIRPPVYAPWVTENHKVAGQWRPRPSGYAAGPLKLMVEIKPMPNAGAQRMIIDPVNPSREIRRPEEVKLPQLYTYHRTVAFNADHADTDEYYESDSETSGQEDVSQSH